MFSPGRYSSHGLRLYCGPGRVFSREKEEKSQKTRPFRRYIQIWLRLKVTRESKKRPGATSRYLGPLWLHTAFSCKPLAAERRMLKAMCGHFIWDTLSVLRGWGTVPVLLPFISLSFSLLSWPSTRLSARGFQPQGAFSARLSAV